MQICSKLDHENIGGVEALDAPTYHKPITMLKWVEDFEWVRHSHILGTSKSFLKPSSLNEVSLEEGVYLSSNTY